MSSTLMRNACRSVLARLRLPNTLSSSTPKALSPLAFHTTSTANTTADKDHTILGWDADKLERAATDLPEQRQSEMDEEEKASGRAELIKQLLAEKLGAERAELLHIIADHKILCRSPEDADGLLDSLLEWKGKVFTEEVSS
eukprot:CAMPEP_0198200764 /NCGR_PEP_ID=MMETSP1445-20131203/3711_1 /TAXON_ID=36898 /ORGANISM="Pyramimonas sp., Strain CCMP2087" /LENGTH=141 /DNA_ID=CAMNT_0043870909 /DNA_START=144 /DNA_END=569 /DNA_ORIENTATION=+